MNCHPDLRSYLKIRKKSLTWCLYFNHSNLNSCWLKSKNIHSKILPAITFPLFFFSTNMCSRAKVLSISVTGIVRQTTLRCRGLSLPWRVCSSIPDLWSLRIRCQQQPHTTDGDDQECLLTFLNVPLGSQITPGLVVLTSVLDQL